MRINPCPTLPSGPTSGPRKHPSSLVSPFFHTKILNFFLVGPPGSLPYALEQPSLLVARLDSYTVYQMKLVDRLFNSRHEESTCIRMTSERSCQLSAPIQILMAEHQPRRDDLGRRPGKFREHCHGTHNINCALCYEASRNHSSLMNIEATYCWRDRIYIRSKLMTKHRNVRNLHRTQMNMNRAPAEMKLEIAEEVEDELPIEFYSKGVQCNAVHHHGQKYRHYYRTNSSISRATGVHGHMLQ